MGHVRLCVLCDLCGFRIHHDLFLLWQDVKKFHIGAEKSQNNLYAISIQRRNHLHLQPPANNPRPPSSEKRRNPATYGREAARGQTAPDGSCAPPYVIGLKKIVIRTRISQITRIRTD